MTERWIGSLTTPTTAAVRRAGGQLRAAVAGRQVGRNAGWALLRSFHNDYALYTAFLFALACGARACVAYEWRATLDAHHWFCHFEDKATGPRKQSPPMLLPQTVVTQTVLYKTHCGALLRRLKHKTFGTPALRQRLAAVASARPVPILFLIGRTGSPVKLGSNELRTAYPADAQLVRDAGRHYFASLLFLARVEDTFIDAFLRHAESGAEPQSSTSLIALRRAHDRVCPLIDGHLAELGLGVLPGISGV